MKPLFLARFFLLAITSLSLPGQLAKGAMVVMDQIRDPLQYQSGLSQAPAGSQIFPDFPAFDAMAIDDFTVAGSGLSLTSISGLFRSEAGFDAFHQVIGYQLSIFSAAELAGISLHGDVVDLLVLPGPGAVVTQVNGGSLGLVRFETNILLPAAGTYWLGISPVASYSAVGAFFLQNEGAQGTTVPGDGNGRFANPGLGHDQGSLVATTLDFAYQVGVVPEPSAPFLLVAGMALLAVRRRLRRHPVSA